MKQLFFDNVSCRKLFNPNCCVQSRHLHMYQSIRDSEEYTNLKKQINESYNKYFYFLGDPEKKFKKSAVKDIEAAIWHLGLIQYIDTELNYTLIKNKDETGPDIICEKGGIRYLIEAVTSTVGENYENPPIQQVFNSPEQNEVKLRLSTTLDNKSKVIKKYNENGVIKDQDIVIVAINSCRIIHARFLDSNDKSLMENILFSTNHLKKYNGKEFDYQFFENHNDTRIDGILYTYEDIALYLEKGSKIYLEFYQNPRSQNMTKANFLLK